MLNNLYHLTKRKIYFLTLIVTLFLALGFLFACQPDRSLNDTGTEVDNAVESPQDEPDSTDEPEEPVEPDPPPPSPLPVFGIYAGAGSWLENVEAISNFLDHYGYEWYQFDAEEAATSELADLYDVIWFPGGFAAEYKHYIGDHENIRSFVHQGGTFIGSCAGAYYASAVLRWSGTAYDYPLSLFEGEAVGPMSGLIGWGSQAEISPEAGHPVSENFPEKIEMCYCDGPYFKADQNGQDLVVLARYIVNDKPAVVAVPFGSGKALLLGPHPELSRYDPSSAGFDLEGGEGSQWPWLHEAILWLIDW